MAERSSTQSQSSPKDGGAPVVGRSKEDLGSSAPGAGSSGWPGGWYVYEKGRVDGPYTAEQAFALSTEASDGKPRLISRKGFTQWYALRDLSEIFRLTEQMEGKAAGVARDPAALSDAVRAAFAGESGPAALNSAGGEPKSTGSAPLSPGPKVQRRRLTLGGHPVSATPTAVAEVQKSVPLDSKGMRRAFAARETRADAAFKSPGPASVFGGSAQKVKADKAGVAGLFSASGAGMALMQEYFVARGRLRLGRLRNPWLTGLCGAPLSLGASWAVWLRQLAREVQFHCHNDERSPLPPAGLALIPLLHIYMGVKLAKLVSAMEQQNRYHFVSLKVAGVLAIFPPFLMVYLQAAANRHWLLHARHASLKKKAASTT